MAKHTPAKHPIIIENNGFRLISRAINRITVYISREDLRNTPVAPYKPILLATLRKFPELGDTVEIDLTPPKILSNRPRVVIYFRKTPTIRHWFRIPQNATRFMSIYIRYQLGFKMILPFNITALFYKEEFEEIT